MSAENKTLTQKEILEEAELKYRTFIRSSRRSLIQKLDYWAKEFEACTFINCNFADSDLSNSRFTDCQLMDYYLSMAKVSHAGMRNVTFLNCKVVGVDFSNCLPYLFEVSFEKCCLDYSNFTKIRLRKMKFKECAIREAGFAEANLAGASFDHCDLSNTVFSRTNLCQTDFRTSRNYLINLNMNAVRKTKFSLSGIASLLNQYNIKIE